MAYSDFYNNNRYYGNRFFTPKQNHSSGSTEIKENKDEYDYPLIEKEDRLLIQKLNGIQNNLQLQENTSVINSNVETKIDYKSVLNPEQYEACISIRGNYLVLAGAGSGKTATLMHRLAYMLENRIDPETILMLTFTNKAAQEMRSRAEKLIGTKAQQIEATTFHSFCLKTLRNNHDFLNFPKNFSILDQEDTNQIIAVLIKEHKKVTDLSGVKTSKVVSIFQTSRNLDMSISDYLDNTSNFSEYILYKGSLQEIYDKYVEYKKKHKLVDFDDLLFFLREKLQQIPLFRKMLQQQYKFIMVDEFQDTNKVQDDILLLISSGNVMAVGDDSQSIFAFRGSKVENILLFKEKFPDAKIIKLNKNYRSSKDILSFSNAIIENTLIGYKKELEHIHTYISKPIIKRLESPMAEAQYIALQIKSAIQSGTSPSQICVLYRNAFHSNTLQAQLIKHNIPFILRGGVKFNERRHIKDLISYLKVANNCFDKVAWLRLLNMLDGLGNATANKILDGIYFNKGNLDYTLYSNKKFGDSITKLSLLIDRIRDESLSVSQRMDIIMHIYNPILEEISEDNKDYKKRMDDIRLLKNMAHKYKHDLQHFLLDFGIDPVNQTKENNANIEESDCIILSTIHSAKGLEWEMVFVINLVDGMFPSEKSFNLLKEMEEERRLFYVACTRAKKRLQLTIPALNDPFKGRKASRFLIEVNETYAGKDKPFVIG